MKKMDAKFSRENFIKACHDERRFLSDLLEGAVKKHVVRALAGKSDPRREKTIMEFLEDLRGLGHEMWRWDWLDEYEVWGFDYCRSPNFGLVVHIDFEDIEENKVYWHDPQGYSD